MSVTPWAVLGLCHLFGLLQGLFNRTDHVERLLWNAVVFAVDDLLEALDRVGNGHVLAGESRELLRNEEGLREEPLDLARARDRQLVLFRQFVDAQNRDDVL